MSERADEERSEEEPWCADVPSDVRPFFERVSYYTRGGVKLTADKTLIRVIRDEMKSRDCSARHLAGELEPARWPAEFRASPEAFVMSKLAR